MPGFQISIIGELIEYVDQSQYRHSGLENKPMNPLDVFDAIFGPINPISRFLGITSATLNGSYKSAGKRNGVIGIASEATKNLTGINTFRFAFPRKGDHTLEGIHELLGKYGIHTFSYLHDHENFYFNVRRSQAKWAEYVLLHAGVELVGPLFDSRNVAYKDRHPPGWMPVPWSESGRGEPAPAESFGASVLDWFDHGRNSSKRTSPEASSNSKRGDDRPNRQPSAGGPEHLSPHRNSIPAREPGGWLDQLDALIDDLL